MRTAKSDGRKVEADIGYAAIGKRGLAYVRTRSGTTLRIPFTIEGDGHDATLVGYRALHAVMGGMRKKGVTGVTLRVPDPVLVEELRGREVPPERLIAHLRLRCTLNRYPSVRIEEGADRDLESRARAELALHVAA